MLLVGSDVSSTAVVVGDAPLAVVVITAAADDVVRVVAVTVVTDSTSTMIGPKCSNFDNDKFEMIKL